MRNTLGNSYVFAPLRTVELKKMFRFVNFCCSNYQIYICYNNINIQTNISHVLQAFLVSFIRDLKAAKVMLLAMLLKKSILT